MRIPHVLLIVAMASSSPLFAQSQPQGEAGFFRPAPDPAINRSPVPADVARATAPAPGAEPALVVSAPQAREALDAELEVSRIEREAQAEAARRPPPAIVSPLDGNAPITSPLDGTAPIISPLGR